jgi:hypothetical protein
VNKTNDRNSQAAYRKRKEEQIQILEQQVKQLHLLSEELRSSNEELKVAVTTLNTENRFLKSQDFKLKSEDVETSNKPPELALSTLSIENELMRTLITQIHIPRCSQSYQSTCQLCQTSGRIS